MADNKVKKGFATYLLILLLIIVAAFLIVIVVMLFSPFQNILGFQYMTYDVNNYVCETTSGDLINFEDIDEINITCASASVKVERSKSVSRDSIRFENYCKGFARAGDRTAFGYDIYFADDQSSVLNIEVQEPEGFILFDSTVAISVVIPADSSYSLENTKLSINNTSGAVMIGNQTRITDDETVSNIRNSINLNSLDVRTNSGNVILYSYIDNTFNDVFIKTNTGRVTMHLDDYNITERIEFHTANGIFNLNNINYTGSQTNLENIVFDVQNGNFYVNSVSGNVSLSMESGYLSIDDLTGNLNSIDSVNQMDTAQIYINNMNGDLNLPFANNSTVNIGSLSQGNLVFINSTSGNIDIGEMDGFADIKTTSGHVSVTNHSDDMTIKTENGNIDVVYDSDSIDSELNFSSTSGRIDIKIRSGFKCMAEFRNSSGEKDNSRVEIQFYITDFTNPLFINVNSEQDTGSLMYVSTDGNVSVSYI